MKFEFSAGGVVFKREKTRKGEQSRKNTKDILVLVAQHSQHHGWVFPKGLIGDKIENEGKEQTAIREVEEETGVLGKILQTLEPITYWYKFKDQTIKKTVYYYLMEYISEDKAKKDDEMEQVEWLPIDEVAIRLTYPSDKKTWEHAKQLIENLKL